MVHTLYQYEVEWVPSDTVKTNDTQNFRNTVHNKYSLNFRECLARLKLFTFVFPTPLAFYLHFDASSE